MSSNPSLRVFSLCRLAALVFSFLDTLLNLVFAVHILTLWYSFRWDAESSEWEWLADKWRVLGIWILFSSYFSAAAAMSVVGLAGVIKNKASLVRFYRDCYIADFAFCASFFTVVTFSVAFQTPASTGICEEFARHPELVRDMQEMGISVENCELWLSRAALCFAALLFTVIIVRLHVLLVISSYNSGLSRCSHTCCISHHRDHLVSYSHQRRGSRSDVKRIFLLPVSSEDAAEDVVMVYAPVPFNLKISHDIRSKAKEARLSETVLVPSTSHQGVAWKHHDSRRHSRASCAGISNNTNHRPNPVFLLVHHGEGLLVVDRDCVKV